MNHMMNNHLSANTFKTPLRQAMKLIYFAVFLDINVFLHEKCFHVIH